MTDAIFIFISHTYTQKHLLMYHEPTYSTAQHMRLTCKIELSKLAAIVAVIILGRLFCFAVNDPGTYDSFSPIDDAPLESTWKYLKEKKKIKILFLLLDGLFIVLCAWNELYKCIKCSSQYHSAVHGFVFHCEKEFVEGNKHDVILWT